MAVNLLLGWPVFAQFPTLLTEKEVEEARNHFKDQEYGSALPVFLKLHEKQINDALLNYEIGICYFYSKSQKLKAIPFLERALNYKTDKVPNELYYFLGRCYHYNADFVPAINMFTQYLESYMGKTPRFTDFKDFIAYSEQAQELYYQPLKGVSVAHLDVPINTSYDDYAPMVSANGSFMLFSSGRRKDSFNFVFGDDYVYLPAQLENKTQDVFMAYRRGLNWTHPYPQDMEGQVVIPLSLSNNGRELLLYMGDDDHSGHIYYTEVKRSRWTKPRKLEGKINSKSGEKGACFSGNNRVVYFSSNRPGGYGGYDLYKSYLIDKNEWSEPENLGPDINTPQDEVYPFMHPDNKTLFFSSNGHASMGGFDIFRSTGQGMYWSKPENLGYPVNTVFDETFFQQSPDRKYSYLSSDRIEKESVGGFDIIRIFRPEKKVPRAMVTGKILAYRGREKLPLSLQVKDLGSDQIQRYVYNPDPQTGKFFMILFPKKNYRISLLFEGKEVNAINLNIPDNTYNYELNHELNFDPILLLGDPVGEVVQVANSETTVTRIDELQGTDTLKVNRYDGLINLMEMIIDRTDVQGLAELNDLEKPVSTALYDFPSGSSTDESKVDEYYTPLIQMVEKAIMEADLEALKDLENAQSSSQTKVVFYEDKASIDSGKRVIKKHEMDFLFNSTTLTVQQLTEIKELAEFLQLHPKMKLEIIWFSQTKTERTEGFLSELGKNRAISIEKILQKHAIGTSVYRFLEKPLPVSKPSEGMVNRMQLKVFEPLR